jgi:arabinosaccharide transport system substrate-binding protein
MGLGRIIDGVRTRVADRLPLGAAPLIILGIAVVSGVWLIFGWLLGGPTGSPPGTIRYWTFANSHYDAYVPLARKFDESHPPTADRPAGAHVDVSLVHIDAVTSRLRAAFWSDLDVPDLVEVEISSAGSFFRGPAEDIGFEDLTDWLKSSGLYDKMVKSRFAPYTHKGRIYGMPHDVHPMMLAYRRDLFEEAGIDASKLLTWDDFIREGRRVTKQGSRYMIELLSGGNGGLEVMLFQRDGGYFDADGNVILDNETAVEAMKWYIPLVAGPNRIASDVGHTSSGVSFAKAIEDGYFLSVLAPDWRTKMIEMSLPQLSGKMALMPLPAAKPGGRRTSTWGGTMLGITKHCPDKALAREVATYMYTEPESLADRFRSLNILPPFKDVWTHPAFKEPRPYWSNQPIGELYVALADDVPPQYTSPYTPLAKAKLDTAVAACVTYYEAHGEEGFDAFVRERLKAAADDIRLQMTRNPF